MPLLKPISARRVLKHNFLVGNTALIPPKAASGEPEEKGGPPHTAGLQSHSTGGVLLLEMLMESLPGSLLVDEDLSQNSPRQIATKNP